MNLEYKKGLQKAIDECKGLYKECVKYMHDCSKCEFYTEECVSECRVFDELIERLEKLKSR